MVSSFGVLLRGIVNKTLPRNVTLKDARLWVWGAFIWNNVLECSLKLELVSRHGNVLPEIVLCSILDLSYLIKAFLVLQQPLSDVEMRC